MATLALGALGAAAGSALLPAGLSILGTTLTGAAIGTQLGAMAGSMIDQALLGASGAGRSIEGPRLSELQITSSTEGAAIPRLYGRARLGGQLIWATNLEEEVVTEELGGGGKGMRTSPSVTQTDYRYYANFAIGLCEGEISGISRVWADGREIALADYTTRLYLGSDTQLLDALIEGKEGTNAAPAYRGLAYIVFDRLPLAEFGNRIPQLSFEVDRSVDDLSARIRGVVMIPGSGEFVYDTSEIKQRVGTITLRPENVHTKIGGTDWTVAVDQLQATLPNVESVSLVVSWFGSSLNAAECTLKPGVDRAEKTTTPRSWSVAGQTRSTAHLVSQVDGRPAYGGTPDDTSVINAITDLKTRGLNVVVSPFILMDVPSSNTLADPYSTASTQPAYPWRGRITVSPAPGRVGTPDKSPAAVSAIDNFIGTAQVSHFAITGTSVAYSGPAEWSFRRMILHYAHLAKAAGGIDAFVLGSELRGLTQVRGAAQSYPMVAALVQLAADVRTVL
ncbi:MAG: glycoside hydrolase TIM-barrel-like domain-containing protein, partial [Hyphomicrobiaceae bacterium]